MIYWMPHAESENLPQGDLTTRGYNQAHKAALWLHTKQIQRIVTSTDSDSLRTASIICHVLGDAPHVTDSRLDIIAHIPTRETLLELNQLLKNITETTLIITRPHSIVDFPACASMPPPYNESPPHPPQASFY
jgi:phosphohistidine phosphatase SixA